jgi:hypothetical protein
MTTLGLLPNTKQFVLSFCVAILFNPCFHFTRFADRYDSDSDSDAHTSDYDDENDDSMPTVDAKGSPALRTSAERAPFSQLNMVLEHARISEPVKVRISGVRGLTCARAGSSNLLLVNGCISNLVHVRKPRIRR